MKCKLLFLNIAILILSLAACGKAVSANGAADETESSQAVSINEDMINIGFAQASNKEGWQVTQTESFYSTFTEKDGYSLSILDAHGDETKQIEQLNQFIEASVDVIFVVPVKEKDILETLERAKEAGILVIQLANNEEDAIGGKGAREMLDARGMRP